MPNLRQRNSWAGRSPFLGRPFTCLGRQRRQTSPGGNAILVPFSAWANQCPTFADALLVAPRLLAPTTTSLFFSARNLRIPSSSSLSLTQPRHSPRSLLDAHVDNPQNRGSGLFHATTTPDQRDLSLSRTLRFPETPSIHLPRPDFGFRPGHTTQPQLLKAPTAHTQDSHNRHFSMERLQSFFYPTPLFDYPRPCVECVRRPHCTSSTTPSLSASHPLAIKSDSAAHCEDAQHPAATVVAICLRTVRVGFWTLVKTLGSDDTFTSSSYTPLLSPTALYIARSPVYRPSGCAPTVWALTDTAIPPFASSLHLSRPLKMAETAHWREILAALFDRDVELEGATIRGCSICSGLKISGEALLGYRSKNFT
ncbi:hypothetical protein NMY22_g18051 [Coprinellus aureogranulatus]|nr:hypothetical protein NMY22_g18051 [Coprinellus aureogranulatus]